MCFGYWQNLFRFVLACLDCRWTAGRHPRSSGSFEDQWGGPRHSRSSRNQKVNGDGGQPHWQTCWKDVDDWPHRVLQNNSNGAIQGASMPRWNSSGPTKNIILPICFIQNTKKKYFHSLYYSINSNMLYVYFQHIFEWRLICAGPDRGGILWFQSICWWEWSTDEGESQSHVWGYNIRNTKAQI